MNKEQVKALPVGQAVRCTTLYGRKFLALKTQSGGALSNDVWLTTDYSALTEETLVFFDPVVLQEV